MTRGSEPQALARPSVPSWLLVTIYFLYLGLPTTASVPLFAEIDWLHEGERMGTAQMVLNGGLPIRDVYTVHGLFPEVIRPLFAFWLFGESLASDRLLGLLIEPLAYVAAVFYLWRLFATPFWRVAGLVSFILFPLLVLPRHIAVFVALGLLADWARGGHSRNLFWAGVIAGFGYLISTMDQASFLLAAVLTLPVVVAVEQGLRRRGSVAAGKSAEPPALARFRTVALPLYKGVLIGILPFLAFLALTGSWATFVLDLFRRGEADFFALSHVWGSQVYPAASMTNVFWYAIPFLYAGLMIRILVHAARGGDERWTAIWPTLLFGAVSFLYALRGVNYWKLAVVAFPFIVGVIYALAVLTEGRQQPAGARAEARRGPAELLVAGLTGVLMLAVLFQALTREWKPQEIAPRVVFPALTGLVLGAAAAGCRARVRGPWLAKTLLVAPPLAAVIVAAWFFHDAKPQLVTALVKKPRLVRDIGQLLGTFVSTDGRLTREQPPYLEDEVVSYLKDSNRAGKRVVVLGAGAGIYYFLSGTTPPNRFPGIEIAMADVWAEEVVAGLQRTGAELLVACQDRGRTMTGWPMNPILAEYIVANYVDSGRRLTARMLGDGCPFSVWVPGASQSRRF